MLIRARKEAFERNLVAHVARQDANVSRKRLRERVAVHDQRPDFRWRILQLRKHGAPQEPRRARNQIFLKHPITSTAKTDVDYLSHTPLEIRGKTA